MKDLKDQCTTLEQSKKLVELGFTKDTASLIWKDFSRVGQNEKLWAICFANGGDDIYNPIPCWTIADMMKILSDARGFSLDVLGQISIYSADEPCKIGVGHSITIRDDYSLLRDNFVEALIALKEDENICGYENKTIKKTSKRS